jgi:hypothetical protein
MKKLLLRSLLFFIFFLAFPLFSKAAQADEIIYPLPIPDYRTVCFFWQWTRDDHHIWCDDPTRPLLVHGPTNATDNKYQRSVSEKWSESRHWYGAPDSTCGEGCTGNSYAGQTIKIPPGINQITAIYFDDVWVGSEGSPQIGSPAEIRVYRGLKQDQLSGTWKTTEELNDPNFLRKADASFGWSGGLGQRTGATFSPPISVTPGETIYFELYITQDLRGHNVLLVPVHRADHDVHWIAEESRAAWQHAYDDGVAYYAESTRWQDGYRLWDKTAVGGDLAWVRVYGASGPAGTITASPNPCTIAKGNTYCTLGQTPTITWSASNTPSALVCLDGTSFGTGLSGNKEATAITYDHNYIFQLRTGDSCSGGVVLDSVTVTATAPPGTVTGNVFDDRNGNGVKDGGEPNVSGVTICLDPPGGGPCPGGSGTTNSNDPNNFSFDAPRGSHTVRIEVPSNWQNTTPVTRSVTVDPNGTHSVDFGVQGIGTITGYVWNDKNGDGVRQGDETDMPENVQVCLTDTTNCRLTRSSFSFNNVPINRAHTVWVNNLSDLASLAESWIPTTAPTLSITITTAGGTQNAHFGFWNKQNAWFQTKGGGDLVVLGNLTVTKVGYLATPRELMTPPSGASEPEGILVLNGNLSIEPGTASPDKSLRGYNHASSDLIDHYQNQAGKNPVTNFSNVNSVNSDGLWRATNPSLTINNNHTFPNNLKAIIFIDQDLTIRGNITLPSNSSIAFIVNGDITIESNSEFIEGIYMAKGTFTTQASNKQFIGRGLFAAGSFSLNRDLDSGATRKNYNTPAEQFVYRPELFLYAHEILKKPVYSWQEKP